MTIYSDFDGTRRDSITIGRGDIDVVGQSIISIRQNNGVIEVKNAGSSWIALFGGEEIRAIKTVTSDYIITEDDYTILADATSNTVVITLPSSPNQGQIFNVFCINATFTCTVARNGNNINGAASDQNLLINEAVTLQFDSVFGWAIL